ncbi:hypothetical protein [Streptomyces sp. NPDC058457]|uniref:hypothetical protein n=1 Tax=Streptomyces sp. NPDC058457 TaxID=3346507 RepID=UPI003669692D
MTEQASEDAFQLKWELRDRGWARCHLTEGSRKVSLTVSYCTDAPADLVAVAGSLYGQWHTTRFFFDAEPQELRWALRATGESVELTIYRFSDVAVSPGLPDSDGTVMWRSVYPRTVFAHAVLDAARQVLAEHGETGYRSKWVLHPFPVGPVQDLRRLHLHDDACELPHDLPDLST